MQFNMHEAKTKLSQLGKKVWEGKRVIIARAGKPYLELIPYRGDPQPRKPGRLKGQIKIAADFDTTPDEIIQAFEDGEE